MAENRVRHRLTVIVSADVVAYARLIGADETGTRAALRSHRTNLIDPKIAEHQGRLVGTAGDSLLVEFESVVEAVQCAVDIQRGMKERNAETPEDRRIVFRIGINLGEVIVEAEDIHGDGVNVAARLQALAEPGGISVSGKVFEEARNRIDVGFEDLGDIEVKNIAKPVRVYQLLLDAEAAGTVVSARIKPQWRWRWVAAALVVAIVIAGGLIWNFAIRETLPTVEAASVERMAFALPDKPSIVVLPFDNLSGDPDQEFLVDGFTEDVTAALSKLPRFFIIARNSAMTYRGRAAKVQEVAEDLGVQYVLEGSVQREGDRLRVNAQLIDAVLGRHIWADRYDRNLTDLFDVRDEITLNIVSNIGAELDRGERDRLTRKETQSLDAWLLFRQGRAAWAMLEKESVFRGMELLEQAFAIDPGFNTARASLAGAYRFAGTARFLEEDEAFAKAEELLSAVISADPENVEAYRHLAALRRFQNRMSEALDAAKRAAEISPNDAEARGSHGFILQNAARYDDAVRELEAALRLSPFSDHWVHISLGQTFVRLSRHREALDVLDGVLEDDPSPYNVAWAQYNRAMALTALGREDEARSAVTEITKASPTWTLTFLERIFAANPDRARVARDLETLRRMGLPE